MKKLVLMIMVFLFGMNGNASDLSTKKNYGDKLPIVLKGSFKDNQIRGEDPIEIYQHVSMILINFNASFGNLDIFIENENGNIVYSTYTNSSSTYVNIIPIENLQTGSYTIIIAGNYGSIEAEFKIGK